MYKFRSVALTLIGGVQHVAASATKVRGESHLLLVGDPGDLLHLDNLIKLLFVSPICQLIIACNYFIVCFSFGDISYSPHNTTSIFVFYDSELTNKSE